MSGLRLLIRQASPTVRLLTVNQFGINVGFYMLMPYLAGYLSGPLGLSAAVAGVVLGVRNLSQQGMFLAGGALADRFGFRPMIIAGCVLRTAAFALLAVATTVPALIVASAVTGLAGALFNPAVRAYVAAESQGHAAPAFALFNVGYQAGILAGPLLGLALAAVDFRLAALAAAVVFGALTAAQWRLLPAQSSPRETGPLWQGWKTAVGNRRFLRFAALMSLTYVLSFQVYLALPLTLTRILGPGKSATAAATAIFVISGLLAVCGQTPIQRWCARLPDGMPLVAGAALMSASFVPPALTTGAILPLQVAGLLGCAALLTAGTLVAYPYEMQTVVALAGNRLVATHYGLYQTLAGLAIAAGTAVTGHALDLGTSNDNGMLVWLGLAVCGATVTSGLYRLRHNPTPASTSDTDGAAAQPVTAK